MTSVAATGIVERARRAIRRRVRAAFPPPEFKALRDRFAGKKGLEIGGPSNRFRDPQFFPVYPVIAALDNCNFASQTIWEGDIDSGNTFVFDDSKPAGRQYIAEATDLSAIADESYDFYLSSHALEHTANPLLALREAVRVVKPGGVLVIVLPHKDATFDCKRAVTSLDHLLADEANATAEDDDTHFQDFLTNFDASKSPNPTTPEGLAEFVAQNLTMRGVHHHVFNTPLVLQIMDHIGLKVLFARARMPHDIVVVVEKPRPGDVVDNTAFLAQPSKAWHSPFPSDRPA